MISLMPRLVARSKRMPIPDQLRDFALTPRHLSLLALLLYDGPATVKELAAGLQVASTTVSLMVGDLNRQGILQRREDEGDRRRTIVSIDEEHRAAIESWLAAGADAWRTALEPLTPAERALVINALLTFERETKAATGQPD
ncbi:MarR family winged helix-turn-helix transcriptional regulator [Streptomyces sp. WMMC500]|uniref:MarR family winged helix-turn-helix transcriptional regulator n=1 Tax=Streptomyces sp. WMMC500 TaxID=3015154 RepID=UPI00248B2F5C|nr:MarR family winged helix-turn-helix transcriptional regulator [Streptomyces sp. WMMC500]WBB64606.1 MarR family winged helix-turn-helix transcriptional regulator [Streptomyces sp. WMMC500]